MTAFFTADLHLGHGNIIRHCNRPFVSADEMDRLLIDVINASVGRNDALYILGDLTGPRAKRDEAIAYRERNLCRHVHLIGGNHDRDCRGTGCFESECFYRKIKLEKRKIILFHYPIAEWDGKWRGSIHLHGHSHNGPEYNQRSIVLAISNHGHFEAETYGGDSASFKVTSEVTLQVTIASL